MEGTLRVCADAERKVPRCWRGLKGTCDPDQAGFSASLINAVSGPVRLDWSRSCVPLTRGIVSQQAEVHKVGYLSPTDREKKAIRSVEEGRDLVGKVDRVAGTWGRGEPDLVLGEGKRQKP